MRIRVIGVGSPHGDDAVGWAVAERLADEPPGPPPHGGAEVELEVVRCERPPLALVDALAGADAAVVVDATRAGLAPGSVHEPAPEDLREPAALSCHGLGVAHALALARELGRAPARLALVGVEAGPLAGDGLSPAAARGAARAADRVRARVARWIAEARAADRPAGPPQDRSRRGGAPRDEETPRA